jgi:DNA ligase (NAD+)
MSDKEARIEFLEQQIRQNNELYWDKEEPEITDSEYDALVRELKGLDPQNEVLFEIGGTSLGKPKVQHPTMMGSQAKSHTADEIRAWMASMPEGSKFVVMLKIDGLACRMEFKDGQLVLAATRGKTGLEGENVTQNVLVASSIAKLNNFTGEIRGEAHMTWDRFKSVNENPEIKKTFANPRNAASGVLSQDDPEEAAKRGIDIKIYDIRPDGESLERLSQLPDYAAKVLGYHDYVNVLPVTPETLDRTWHSRSTALSFPSTILPPSRISATTASAPGHRSPTSSRPSRAKLPSRASSGRSAAPAS